MRGDRTATFTFRGIDLAFRDNITYHDHLWRIYKALRIILKVECERFNPHLTDWGSVFEYDRQIAAESPLFQEMAVVALDAMVELGYDRERMGFTIRKWLNECAENALKELVNDADSVERGEICFT